MMHKGGWKSRKQSIQPHFTAEAGYMTVDEVARDLVWERRSLDAIAEQISRDFASGRKRGSPASA